MDGFLADQGESGRKMQAFWGSLTRGRWSLVVVLIAVVLVSSMRSVQPLVVCCDGLIPPSTGGVGDGLARVVGSPAR